MDHPIESVFIQGHYVGCVLPRGCQGFEAFDNQQRSLGVFQERTRPQGAGEGAGAMRGLLGFYLTMLAVVIAIWIAHSVPA
jgi:hypothetical protein